MTYTRRPSLILSIVAVLVVLIGPYVATYYVTATPMWRRNEVAYPRLHGPLENPDAFRSWQRWKTFFAPVHWLDRRCRRFYWRPLEAWESP